MLELQNQELRLEILDPVAESRYLGPRFCGGGFLWQVHDRVAGPLLSGPEFPHPSPDPFNGQGAPESFRHRTMTGQPLTWSGQRGVALGAGELALDEVGQVFLQQPCVWAITPGADRVRFTTQQTVASFAYEMERLVSLEGRTVRCGTRLTNTAATRLVLQWFAHPFLALTDGAMTAQLPVGTTMKANPGFALNGRALSQVRKFTHMHDGHMEPIGLPPAPLHVVFAHPVVTEVTFTLNRAPHTCVIWGNDRTFSVEPYLDLDLAAGASLEWEVSYGFGRPKARAKV